MRGAVFVNSLLEGCSAIWPEAVVGAVPTEEGLRRASVESSETSPSGRILVADCGSVEVVRLLGDELFESGESRYRVVEAVVRREPNDTWSRIRRRDLSQGRSRFALRQLFHLDPVESAWVATEDFDLGDATGVFDSNFVGLSLAGRGISHPWSEARAAEIRQLRRRPLEGGVE